MLEDEVGLEVEVGDWGIVAGENGWLWGVGVGSGVDGWYLEELRQVTDIECIDERSNQKRIPSSTMISKCGLDTASDIRTRLK